MHIWETWTRIMGRRSTTPQPEKAASRLPLICRRCSPPKILKKLTQHLQEKHQLCGKDAKDERKAVYGSLIENIQKYTILDEAQLKSRLKGGHAIKFKDLVQILEETGHIIVRTTADKPDASNPAKKITVNEETFFEDFPCSAEVNCPSKKEIKRKYGDGVDFVSLRDQWVYKQMHCRAIAVVQSFQRKKPNDQQVNGIFVSKKWPLNKKQRSILQMKINDKWFYARPRERRKPLAALDLLRLIDEQSWEGLEVIPDLEGRGRGIFATKHFEKGDIICDYQGEMIEDLTKNQMESYFKDKTSTIYIMQMKHNSKYTLIDATSVDKIGRLVNHSHRHNNVRPEKRILGGKVCILIVARDEIQAGQEVLFDYGDIQSSLPECVPGCADCLNEGRPILQESSFNLEDEETLGITA